MPKVPSMNIMDLVKAIAPDASVEYIGIRPGEKLHEVLISEDESRHTIETDDMYVVLPLHPWWHTDNWAHGRSLSDGFRYSSDNNPEKLTVDELRVLVREIS